VHYDEQTLRPAIQAAFDQGGLDEVCRRFVTLLNEQEARHRAENAKLEARITELEKRLGKNSTNSSKPPSSDGLKRTKSQRPKNSGRKPGGQPGHPGQTLPQSKSPDITVAVPLDICPDCGEDLSAQPATGEEIRQVFDLPPVKMQVTEYRAQRKTCPNCGRSVSAEFPPDVCAPVQYGPGMQAVMSYLNVRQVIPCERTAEICQDLLGHRPSAGSVVQAAVRCAQRLAPAMLEIRDALIQSPVLHCDETGIRCIGKTHWLHVASTANHSLYSYSPKRGIEGFDVAGVLPVYKQTLIHDFWGPYDTLDCLHGRCNSHLLRELKSCAEDKHIWAEQLILALLAAKQAADQARENGKESIDSAHKKALKRRYDKWVRAGLKAHPEQLKPTGKRGRIKQSTEHNLLRRLRDKREEVLRFIDDLEVPFDNNQAERDLRMIKVQQKVSGCFRSTQGAERFCIISSYISTVRKQGMNLMEAIKSAFTGNPVSFRPE
jgi:transposase